MSFIDTETFTYNATDKSFSFTLPENIVSGTVISVIDYDLTDAYVEITVNGDDYLDFDFQEQSDGKWALVYIGTEVIDFEDSDSTSFDLLFDVYVEDSDGEVIIDDLDASVSVSVTDVDEPAVLTSPSSYTIDKSQTNGAVVATITGVDPDAPNPDEARTVRYYLDRDSDEYDIFRLNSRTGVLTVKDAELLSEDEDLTIDVTVFLRASADGNASHREAYTITINLEEATTTDNPPVISLTGSQTLTLNEGESDAVLVATGYLVSATDADDDAITFSVSDSRFVVSDGKLQVKAGQSFDHETESEITLTISATSNGVSVSETVTIAVTDINDEIPVITSAATVDNIAENSGAGQTIYTVTALPDILGDTVQFYLNGADGSHFSVSRIDATSAHIILTADPDYEAKSSYEFSIKAVTGEGTDIHLDKFLNLTLDIDDVDEAPVLSVTGSQTATVTEGSAGRISGSFETGYLVSATNPQGSGVTLSVDDARFIITSDGMLKVKRKPSRFDFETEPEVTLTIKAQDDNDSTLYSEETVTISITDTRITLIDLPDKLFYRNFIVAGTQVGDAHAVVTGVSGGARYELSGDDAALFNIDSTTGIITARNKIAPLRTREYDLTVTAYALNGDRTERVSDSYTVEINKFDFVGETDVAFTSNWNVATTYNLPPDRDDDAVTYQITDAPEHGTATISGGVLTYTPTTHYWGSDSFIVRVTETASGRTEDITYEATINPVADSGYTLRKGSAAAETLTGGDGQDHLFGGPGNDVLKGGAGRDKYTIIAGNGNDVIIDPRTTTETVTERVCVWGYCYNMETSETVVQPSNVLEIKLVGSGDIRDHIQLDIVGTTLTIGISNTAVWDYSNPVAISTGSGYGHWTQYGTGLLPTDSQVHIQNWESQFDTFILGGHTFQTATFLRYFDKDYTVWRYPPWESDGFPVVLDLDDDGLEYIDSLTVPFDWDGDGDTDEQCSWVGADDGLLVYDKNGDGQVAHDEISFLSYLEGAASDLAALVAFDTDEDGWLDSDDAEFAKFKVWNDADSDGVVDTGELQTLGQHDIARLRLTPTPDSGKELAHVKVVATSIYELTDGTEHLLGDVAFSITEQAPPDII